MATPIPPEVQSELEKCFEPNDPDDQRLARIFYFIASQEANEVAEPYIRSLKSVVHMPIVFKQVAELMVKDTKTAEEDPKFQQVMFDVWGNFMKWDLNEKPGHGQRWALDVPKEDLSAVVQHNFMRAVAKMTPARYRALENVVKKIGESSAVVRYAGKALAMARKAEPLSISQPVHQQTKRPKALVTQQSLSSGTRAMTTRSSSVVSVPVYPEIERPKMRAKHSRNIKDVCYPTFLRIKCDKKHFPVMKSSCETVKGIMTICSHDIKCSPVLLNEQLLNMTSSKSFHIFTTKECFPYFRDVASNDSNAFSKDELVDTLQTTSEFALIVGEDSMQTTICDVLQKLNAHFPVAGLIVTNKESAHQSPDLLNVIFDTTVSNTIMKKADSLLNRCVHQILTVLYGKLAEAPFDPDDKVIVFDVCDMIKSSFQRNMIPEMECPKIPEQGFSYPHNIDKVIDYILREEAVMGCLKKLGTLYIYLKSLTQRSDIEKKIQDLMVNHGVSEFEPVFKYVTLEHLCSSGDWACNGTLGGFAMKHTNVTSGLNDHNLVALISRHVAKNTNEQFLLVGQNRTNLGSLDGMNYFEDMDIYPVMVDPNQTMNCDTNFRTEDDNAMQAKPRSTNEIEILNGSIVHIWGHTTSPGLGIVVEKPVKTPNGKIIFVRDRNHEHSFAEPGDSGAMVCYYDPKGEVLYAVGMLIGRCNSSGAVSSGRYAAQVLDDGLRALSEINECTLLFSDNSVQ